jgi:glycosyltransferase involved in cell wall biosynthesis
MHDLEGKVVLYLGQLHGAQYVELFIRAAHRIISRRQDVIFMIVGMGDRFGELHALTERLGIGHKIVFTGSVSHHMVPQYIAAADVAVACFEDNKQTRSKSPLKVVEYMASGKAIVATDMGEVRKMLQGCAILAKPGDVGSLVTRIETLLDNPMLRSELGQKARKRAEDEYNWSVTASNLLEAYHVGLEQ